jgi:hypothetical protein
MTAKTRRSRTPFRYVRSPQERLARHSGRLLLERRLNATVRSAMKERRSPLEVLWDLNNRVEQAQEALADYLPNESGIAARDAINNVLGILDRELLKTQDEARELLGERPAFFRAD